MNDHQFMASFVEALPRIALWHVTVALTCIWLTTACLRNRPVLCSWLWRLAISKCGLAWLLAWSLAAPILSVELFERSSDHVTARLDSSASSSSRVNAEAYQASESISRPFESQQVAESVSSLQVTATEPSMSQWWCGGWMAGALLIVGAWGWQWRRLQIVLRASSPLADSRLESMTREMARALGLGSPPRILVADVPVSPLLVGCFRPTIVLPTWLTESGTDAELRGTLAHEMAHARRRDLIWNLFAACIGLAVYYHPLIWLALRRLRLSQESAADQLALRASGAAMPDYARLLLKIATHARGVPAPHPGLLTASRSFHDLNERIRSMQTFQRPSRSRFFVACLCAVALIIGLVPWHPVSSQRVAAFESPAPESQPAELAAADAPAAIAEAPPAGTKTKDRGPEIDAAIARLRKLGAFVREFHPRGNPEYWVQIISTGLGEATHKDAYGFDDEAMQDVEIIARGVIAQLHLRRTAITSAGLERLASAGKIEQLELAGSNVDDRLLKVLPKLPLRGRFALDSNELTDEDIEPLADCRQLTSIAITGRLLTNDCLEYLVRLPKLEGITLGNNFTPQAFTILARLEGLKDLNVAWQATPLLSEFARFPKLRKLSLSGIDQDDETALTIANSFKSLEQAYLRQTSITNAGVKDLSRLEKLEFFALDGAAIDDGIADSIRKMKQLKWLSLDGCQVGDPTLAAVSECPELWFLSLSDTMVGDEGVAQLTKLKKLEVLYLSCKFVTDDSIKSLIQLAPPENRNLHLNVQASGITEQGARKLQGALPRAQIVWGVPPVPLP